jgi:L-lactate dehydrogenase complex protein LldG
VSDRELILARIRAALADVPATEPPAWERGADPDPAAAYQLPRDRDPDDLAGLFESRCGEYRATVTRCDDDNSSIKRAIAGACERHHAHAVIVAPGLTTAWIPGSLQATVDEPPLSLTQLDATDAVITGCALAIAQTGTIALDTGPGQGRRALTLVPDLHICILRAPQIVHGVIEAIDTLATAIHHSNAPITLISGPSATSDIELQRVEGVHGPRRLEVVLAAPTETLPRDPPAG